MNPRHQTKPRESKIQVRKAREEAYQTWHLTNLVLAFEAAGESSYDDVTLLISGRTTKKRKLTLFFLCDLVPEFFFFSSAVPHGILSVVPMIFSVVAITLTLIASLVCNFLVATMTTTTYSGAVFDDEGNVTHIDEDVLYNRRAYGLSYGCRSDIGNHEQNLPSAPLTSDEQENHPFNPFTDPDYDPQTENAFRAAAACGYLAAMVGGSTLLYIWLTPCIAYRRVALILMGVGFSLASIFSFFMLIAFSAPICDEHCIDSLRNQTNLIDLDIPLTNACNAGCYPSGGAGCAIGAGFLWLVCAVVTFILQGPGVPVDGLEQEKEEMEPLTGAAERKVEEASPAHQDNLPMEQAVRPVATPIAPPTGPPAEAGNM